MSESPTAPGPLAGIRVVEVAQWVMVPGASAILADWGADVIKIEDPIRGDGIRGLNGNDGSIRYRHMVHNANRGKRSIGLDLTQPEGRAILQRIVESSDVFITNLLPGSRTRLRIDVDDVHAWNPNIVYARGSGLGPRGPEAVSPGYDFAQFWARGGLGEVFRHPSLAYPLASNPQFGDSISASVLAGGIAAALLQRERTRTARVVDVSLLGVAAWTISQDVVVSAAGEQPITLPTLARDALPNPLTNVFRTADGRFLAFVLLQSDRDWPKLCGRLGLSHLQSDPRFADARARALHAVDLVGELDKIFGARTLEEWQQILAGADFVWSVYQTPAEVAIDPQTAANDYLVDVADAEGSSAPPQLIASPVQFDERSCIPRPGPEHAEHTEAILLELGFDWDEIVSLKDRGIVP